MPNTHPAAALARLPRLFARAVIRMYQLTLSPFLGSDCRHLPTCSAYGDEAIARFGLWAGGWMTLARFCRCQPLGTRGLDFVPAELPAGARWWLPWRYGRWRGTNETPPPRPAAEASGCGLFSARCAGERLEPPGGVG
ncbi:MAG: membrane protein insertion efficiency factor YidD [Rhodoplanes sp.]|uniref:membrane protein insertion efficiency factor YidD n=1 Tax=Rhodoplanes sp. TaxID=1968906 RepID=UPI00179F0E28|nr:membrane protein insertion efficiency factor YidD [Rhodoplanes sp.]NVO17920.1 membrane protein insertion efficiency factor YidD [Rhodoplanes sp.]